MRQPIVRTLLGCYGRPIDCFKSILQKYPGFQENCVNLKTGSKKENIRLVARKCGRLVKYLEAKNHILLLTTSTRYQEHPWDIPKSTQLALRIEKHLKQNGKHVTALDVANLRIHTCEGNISAKRGNNCGVLEAKLRDKAKNPTGQHRCWASINNKDDQLYKISRELFKSQAVVFFVSVRWGQTNSVYQRLFEHALAGSRIELRHLEKSRYPS